MALTGGYTRNKTRGEKIISTSSSLKKRSSNKLKMGGKKHSSTKLMMGGKKQKTLKRRKQKKSRKMY